MNNNWFRAGSLLCGTCFVAFLSASLLNAADDSPAFGPDNQLIRPSAYREWIWLSSGLGMTYGPGANTSDSPSFDNVFVNRSAYQAFQKTGTWPDGTTMVLEVRASGSNGSINRGGHYQTDVRATEVHVKDSHRFKGNWAFYGFEGNAASAKPIPQQASCYSCHEKSGAVDTTFVQFYPTLIDTAKAKGTFSSLNDIGQK